MPAKQIFNYNCQECGHHWGSVWTEFTHCPKCASTHINPIKEEVKKDEEEKNS